MNRCRGGCSTPSYKEAVAIKGKRPSEKRKGDAVGGRKIGMRNQKVPNQRRRMAQKTRKKMTKYKEQKTKIKRDNANPELKLLLE